MTPPWRDERVRSAYQRPEIKASVEIILSVFMVVVMLSLAIRPTIATVGSLQKKITDQQAVDAKLTDKITQLIRANQDLTSFSEQLQEYESAVPSENQVNEILKRIILLATEKSVKIESLSIDPVPLIGTEINLGERDLKLKRLPVEPNTNIVSFGIKLDISGGQNELISFLDDLEKLDRIVILSDLSIKKAETRDSKTNRSAGTLTLSAKGVTYYEEVRPTSTSITPAPTPAQSL